MNNQKHFFDSLAHHLRIFLQYHALPAEIRSPEDWYHVKTTDVMWAGGTSLLKKHYSGSLYQALASLYPHVHWLPWKYVQSIRCIILSFRFSNNENAWTSAKLQREFLDWFSKEYKIMAPQDWFQHTAEHVIKAGGSGLLQRYRGKLLIALSSLYQTCYIMLERWLT